jgi:addiction module HigA family antidote
MTRTRPHPGEILREVFMVPLELSANALALALHVPATRIGAVIRQKSPRAIMPDTAMRLARYFVTTPEFWLNLQTAYDLSVVRKEKAKQIADQVKPRAA